MNNKALGLIIGAVGGVVIIIVAALIMSRPSPAPIPERAETLTSADFKTVKDKTSGLENFGNLPIIVSGDDIGRSNPFESY
jgi:hypothetical protein